jgi:FkbM family methyltransferase
LIINRSPKNFFENVALVSENYLKNNNKIYLIENNLYSKVNNNNNVLNSKEVVATTLNNILKKYNIYKVNFFSLDVEGYEKEVLEGLDLNVFHIDYILIETNYFDQINLILKNYNYILLKKLSIHDYLYKKNTNLEKI